MINHIIDSLVDYFTNLNAKKIIGGILVFVGLTIIGKIGISRSPNIAVLYAIVGILIGGIGFVVIYYDMARDKVSHGYDELGTLTSALKKKDYPEKISAWHMPQEPDKKSTPDNN